MKDKFVQAYMDVAKRFSLLSTAKRLQVGAIIVKDDRIISIGYNGMPSGWDNNCENTLFITKDEAQGYNMEGQGFTKTKNGNWTKLKSKPEVLHAESNAIAKLARSSESGKDAAIFVTHQPCLECAKLIFQAGISSVYYSTEYRLTNGVDFLNTAGVLIVKV
jgi:dCMP deaminase|tara:strand:- start:12097 stop:12582 length:486 start_codon:yes stop_codon:yes gene_type:complete